MQIKKRTVWNQNMYRQQWQYSIQDNLEENIFHFFFQVTSVFDNTQTCNFSSAFVSKHLDNSEIQD